MSKEQLTEWLQAHEIEVPATATIRQLRTLYAEHTENSEANMDAEEEEKLDNEVRILQKRKLIADLRREIADILPFDKAPDFQDIKCLVPPFAGGDLCVPEKWLNDFECVCDTVGGGEDFRLKCIRRLMAPGTEAEWFLRIDRSASYAEFRRNFLANFGHTYTVGEVLDKLRKSTFVSSKTSVMGYILKMQELASRADIEEAQTVQIIIDGFRDQTADISILYPAQDLQQLKQLARRYTQLREIRSSRIHPASSVPETKPISKAAPNRGPDLRCYNCSGKGHISARCMEPRRQPGSCFRCGSDKHVVRDCSKPAPRNKDEVALIDDFRRGEMADDPKSQLKAALPDLNTVSVAFLSNQKVHSSNSVLSLFDTGSPINLIRRSAVPSELIPAGEKFSGFRSIGGFPICTYAIIPAYIIYEGHSEKMKLYVVPDHFMNHPLLLGREFLQAFGIILFYTRSNKYQIQLRSNKEIQISDKLLHCVYDSFQGESNPGGECHLCSRYFVSHKPNSDKVIIPDIYAIELDEDVHINPKLAPSVQNEIMSIIKASYLDLNNIPEKQHSYEMRLKLTSEIPISYGPRRLSYADKVEVDKIIENLLLAGIIRPSNSPYSFPIVLRTKKSGERRLCVDYRSLNKITVRDSYPIPLIDDCLERVEGKKYFTVLDLKNGFHQVMVAPDSVPFTAFVTPHGQYEYVKMPFGLRNAPAVFQRFINMVLEPFIKDGSIVVYMDDVTLATHTLVEHFNLLKRVLRRLAEFRLEIKIKKCQFCFTEIELLGFTVSKKGIRPNNSHLEAIKSMPFPSDVKQVSRCLGLFSYFRRFVPSFSTISLPLRNAMKSGSKFEFDDRCKQAFTTLRDKLISAPILALYNPSRETELHCDASTEGFGGILLQKQDDGKLHPIAYFSKRTTSLESRYHSFELETLAIIYSLRKFRIYLEGIQFRIVTDCNSLAMTLSKKTINARIARWALELENYHYSIQHRSGNLMNHVDALSRNPFCSDQFVSAVNSDDIDFQLQLAQGRDETILRLREHMEGGSVKNFTLDDGLVYRNAPDAKLLFYVPSEMESHVIRNVHEKLCHMGMTKTLDQIRMHYWFPKMKKKVETYIKNCVRCILYSDSNTDNGRVLHSIPKKPIPFDTIHVDHFGPLPSITSKRKHILVVVDAFTKYVKLYAVNSTSTKEVCACLDKYFECYSRPRRIISDRGSCFTSLEFDAYLSENNVEHVKIATASAQANGQVERVNRVLKAMLGKLSEPVQHSDWVKMLGRVEYAMNNSIHSSTHQTPSVLLFGVAQRGLEVDNLSEYLEDRSDLEPCRDLNSIREVAARHIEESQGRNSASFHKRFPSPTGFTVGEYVVIRNVDTTVGTNKKFIPKYRGPYRVHKVLPNDRYVIRDIENCQISQLPYDGIIEAARIKRWADWRTPKLKMIENKCTDRKATLVKERQSHLMSTSTDIV